MQFDRKRNEQQGLGFGLIISKRLTELHNGTFEIRSDASTGSIINISFPVTGGFN
jgi:signal transduction histidine kinase